MGYSVSSILFFFFVMGLLNINAPRCTAWVDSWVLPATTGRRTKYRSVLPAPVSFQNSFVPLANRRARLEITQCFSQIYDFGNDMRSNDDNNNNAGKRIIPLLIHFAPSILPLPSGGLPSEISTLHVYRFSLQSERLRCTLHPLLSPDDIGRVALSSHEFLGHIWCDDGSNAKMELTPGMIGCASQIVHVTKENLVVRGTFRFVVENVVRTNPFPLVQVRELRDYDGQMDEDQTTSLLQQLFDALKVYCHNQYSMWDKLSPLEREILQEYRDNNINYVAQKMVAEEKLAVLQVCKTIYSEYANYRIQKDGSKLPSSLPFQQNQYRMTFYEISMMAAELADLDSHKRQSILQMTDTIERLHYVLHYIQQHISLVQAQKLAQSITDQHDEAQKELQVGEPHLPPWAKFIRKGMRLSYYWNDEYGWCEGIVTDEPLRILDEIVLRVRFDDGEVHRLPFRAEEKARWRPTR